MRNGVRIFDADTHVRCAAEVIEPWLDAATREKVGDLDKHKVEIKIGQAGEKRQPPYKHYFRFHRGEGWGGSTPRHLGEAEPRADTERDFQQFMGSRFPTEGANQDPKIRLRDMDEEGTDVHLMVPTGPNEHKDPTVEMGFIQANHRFLDDYCSADPARLKSLIVTTGRSIEDSVKEIHAWGSKRWSIGVFPHLPLDFPLDHPDLNPIWEAAMEHGLPGGPSQLRRWLSGLPRPVGQPVSRSPVIPSLGSHARGGLVSRRWGHGSLPRYQVRCAGVRLRLAAVLGQAHG